LNRDVASVTRDNPPTGGDWTECKRLISNRVRGAPGRTRTCDARFRKLVEQPRRRARRPESSPCLAKRGKARMDARIVAATDDEVVVLWHQRGISPTGERCDTPVLGLYLLRDGKLARAQMFYFDSAEVGGFLRRAKAA